MTHLRHGPASRDQGQSLDAAPLDAAAAALLDRWLQAVLATPGLTGLRDPDEARRVLVDDALRALPIVRRYPGPIVDVGSGGGSPGLPLAIVLRERRLTLLEAERRKADFLRSWQTELTNVEVVWGRAEEQSRDVFGVALAKALAPPVVAAEWCLPLVRPGGVALLWVGPSADPARVARVAERVGGELLESVEGFLLLGKHRPTPPGFPRRPGIARKRPLA